MMKISKQRLNEIKDQSIDYSDIPETSADFWANAELKMPVRKDRITMRIDADVLVWPRSDGKRYQSRINAILRQYMDAHAG
jgi:uncharacterized protein (DUF4415 family)